MWYRKQPKRRSKLRSTKQDKIRVKLFQSRNVLCYTAAQVKRDERKILQWQQLSLYIHTCMKSYVSLPIATAHGYHLVIPADSEIPPPLAGGNILSRCHVFHPKIHSREEKQRDTSKYPKVIPFYICQLSSPPFYNYHSHNF